MPRAGHQVTPDHGRWRAAMAAVLVCMSVAGCSSSGTGISAGPTASVSPRAASPIHLFYSANSMDPTFITNGPDGNLWFTDAATPDQIGRITTSGAIYEFANPSLNH